jgi:glycosyltransferase involved in cell wall biosynthesis
VTPTSATTTQRWAFVSGNLDLGGTTTFMCNLAGELIRRNQPAFVLSFEHHNPLAQDFQRLNIPVFATDERRMIFEDCARAILEQLAQFKPTVVIANLSATSFEILRYLPKGVLRVGTAQAHAPRIYEAARYYPPHVDCMAAVSRTIVQTLRSMPEFSRTPIHYLPYGVMMPAEGNALPRPETPLRILYFGRLVRPQKRVQLFPEILQALADSRIPFHWTIAGEGAEEDFLRSVLKTSLPGQSISFVGKVLYGDVPALLARHDVFLLASDSEGLPLSLLEAMAAGLVPVVSDLASGIREVVDDTTGKLVAPENTRGYAEAIVALHGDRKDFARLSANARQRVRAEFSIPAMTERWLKVVAAHPASEIIWPRRWKVKAILEAPHKWRFTTPVRPLRRLMLRLKRR